MEFKELLEKKKYKYGNDEQPMLSMPEVIMLSDLGEWAWNEIAEDYNYEKKEIKKARGTEIEDDAIVAFYDFWDRGETQLLKEIAVACLGKKEIEKRLMKLEAKNVEL